MTQQEFLTIADNYRDQVNVWYTATIPYSILGLTVPTVNNAGENVIGYLQQATVITVQINEDTGQYATLNIVQRSLLGEAGSQYYFFNTSVDTIQDPGDGLIRPGQIIFTPGINGLGFQEGGYNVTAGLTNESRRSDYIMQADTISYISTGAGLPTNIEQLETNTATRAQVQDSQYSDTGWISGRYEGSKISTLTNLGADPALQGTFFEGATFSLDTDDDYIMGLQAVGALTYGDYFFSGEGTVPRCVIRETNWFTNLTLGDPNTQGIQQTNPTIPETPLKIGDRFYLSSSASPVFSPQVIQMVPPSSDTYYPYENYDNTIPRSALMRIKRGYNNTPQIAIPTGATLYRISPIKLFTLESQLIQALKQGKLIVKGMDEVLYIDVNGFVISGTTPQIVEL